MAQTRNGGLGLTVEVEDDHLDRILGSELDLGLRLEETGKLLGDPPVVHREQLKTSWGVGGRVRGGSGE